MAKITSLETISSEFGIDPKELEKLDIIDTQLTVDTNLFIDPLLLPESKHEEINTGAATAYEQRFEFIIKLLAASKEKGDITWRKAEKLFNFSEVSWTCLGYSASVRGSGFGPELTSSTLETAAQIVALGITDIDFFMGLSLFEEGIGPDRISDMTTNIILPNLIDFTIRQNDQLKLPTKPFKIKDEIFFLPENPHSKDPLIFVPRDIVRDLPIASDWSDISRIARETEEYREKVSGGVGKVWATMSKKRKQALRDSALQSKEAFEQILDLLKEVPKTPYNFEGDRNGEAFWTRLKNIADHYPLTIGESTKNITNIEEAKKLVDTIILQFQDLVENKGIWKELWSDEKKPRREKAAQRLFFVIAYSYCKANNLDVTPEADTGNGPVDFKFSLGFNTRIVVEIKLSTNDLVNGYTKQLEIYKKAEDTQLGIYLVIDVGSIGQKYNEVQRMAREAIDAGKKTSTIYLVDGNRRESASKRK
ncbi:hypothetical protein C4J93_3482 [Pseudomonas sp. R2-37-08W]|uniref:hypothetical protein n=1 Tax=Pseudomonas sp. R2-37-08W TaxID=1173273 RepID=UPI000F5711E3|nr:hypothetical protein [Pseudomonas sp. R2-37-08W]AZF11672.1 hypothetical protein C4J93_3482 [Pseudomonas sp. R2-37-08W]